LGYLVSEKKGLLRRPPFSSRKEQSIGSVYRRGRLQANKLIVLSLRLRRLASPSIANAGLQQQPPSPASSLLAPPAYIQDTSPRNIVTDAKPATA
jgi:hypothetical protein